MSFGPRTLCELGMSTIIRVDDANFVEVLSNLALSRIFSISNHMFPHRSSEECGKS